MRTSAHVFLLSSTLAIAAPIEERQAPFQVTSQAPWNAGAVTEFQIHSSCNGSERYQLQQGLDEAIILAQHAKDHILRWGNSSDIYQKYFGNRPTVEAIGSLDIIVNGDKGKALFRCDDPDGNCGLMPTWGGHWRGSNASDETVICPASFRERRTLAQVCSLGYNVRQSSRLLFWASDLIHRLYHIPAIGQGFVDHYAEGYEEIVEAASLNSPNATHDSDGLQYFALEAWAHDVINPGAGCPGPAGELPSSSSSSEAASTATSSAVASSAASVVATATSSALPDGCHTHADGAVHCSGGGATTSSASAEPAETGGQDCHTHADGTLHCE